MNVEALRKNPAIDSQGKTRAAIENLFEQVKGYLITRFTITVIILKMV